MRESPGELGELDRAFGGVLVRTAWVSAVTHTLSLMADYVENAIRREQDLQRDAYQRLRSTEPEVPDEESKLWLEPEYSFYMYTLPRILRGSFVVTAYSAIEAHLNRLCDFGADKVASRMTYRDITKMGGPIQRALLYMEKVLERPVHPDSAEWRKIKEGMTVLASLRHAIVHSEGFDRDGKLVQYSVDHPEHIVRKANGDLVVQGGYLAHVVELTRRLFKYLVSRGADSVAPNKGMHPTGHKPAGG